MSTDSFSKTYLPTAGIHKSGRSAVAARLVVTGEAGGLDAAASALSALARFGGPASEAGAHAAAEQMAAMAWVYDR